jgi:hypothetical protein
MIGANIDISDRRQAEAEREKLLAGEQAPEPKPSMPPNVSGGCKQ